MKILLSIKPEYVEKIFNGTKTYEYRKCPFKQTDIRTVVVYSTLPVGQLVGEFEIDGVISDEPVALWETTQHGAGIDADFFDAYFEGRASAVAFKIGVTRLYPVPVDPKDVFEKFVAPQSFRYITDTVALDALPQELQPQ